MQRTNTRRFTVKSWAVSARLLEQRRDRTAVDDLMGFLDWLGDKNAAIIKRSLPVLPCQAGCCYCCHVAADLPDLLPPEALRIAAFIRRQSPALLPLVAARLEGGRAEALDTATPDQSAARGPCLFLHQERCLIYPVRPMRCRAQNSPDVEACRQNYLGQRVTIPLISEIALLYQSLQTGLRLGLDQVGLHNERLALRGAMAIALEESDAVERWLQGESLFDGVRLLDQPDEEQSLARFARQAKHQARAELGALQGLMTMFADQPGAWALYTTSGVEPRLPAT